MATQNKDYHVHIRIGKAELAQFKRAAKKAKKSWSIWVREALAFKFESAK